MCTLVHRNYLIHIPWFTIFFVIRIWITCISLYLLVGLLGKSLKSFKTLEVGVLITICPGHDFAAAILVSLEQLLVTLNVSVLSLVHIYF